MKSPYERTMRALQVSEAALDRCVRGAVGVNPDLSRTGVSKCRAHLQAAANLLQLSREQRGVGRARLTLSGFDATWMGWNSLYAREHALGTEGDRRRHLAVAGRAGSGAVDLRDLRRDAVAQLRDALAHKTTKRVGARDVRKVRPVARWIVEAGSGSSAPDKLAQADLRLRAAARSPGRKRRAQALQDSVEGLYELRCRRLHGDLVASTVGTPAAMERLALGGAALTVALIASRLETSAALPASGRRRQR